MSSHQPPASSSHQAHPSLPQKPPPSSNGSSKAFAFKPRSVNNPVPPPSYPSPQPAYPSAFAPPSVGYAAQPAYYSQSAAHSYDYPQPSSPPEIVNPFTAPPQVAAGPPGASGTGGFDAEDAAAIAQWQSAYAGANDQSYSKATSNSNNNSAVVDLSKQEQTDHPNEKKKTVVRSGGGESWQDDSLLEWDPTHPRFFVGNLAGEVSDDSLLKAFGKYSSVVKARVVRDKRSTKSKGFGFVSFSNAEEFQRAGKEMQGKYIGSHPIILRRSKTDIKAVNAPDKHSKQRGKGGNAGGSTNSGGGVQKQQKKDKGGLSVLG